MSAGITSFEEEKNILSSKSTHYSKSPGASLKDSKKIRLNENGKNLNKLTFQFTQTIPQGNALCLPYIISSLEKSVFFVHGIASTVIFHFSEHL